MSNERHTSPPAYFLSLSLENVRSFGDKQTISFTQGGIPTQWTIILGNNGVGKTTILKSLAAISPIYDGQTSEEELSLEEATRLGRYQVSFLRLLTKWSPIRHDGEKLAKIEVLGRIGINLVTKARFASKILQKQLTAKIRNQLTASLYTIDEAGLICYGYGAGRTTGTTSLSESQNTNDTCISLFDDKANLMNPEEWFLQFFINSKLQPDNTLISSYYDRVKQALLDVLPDVTDLKITSVGRPESPRQELQLYTPYGWVRLSEMSLGYQTLTVWLTDLASRLFERYPTSPNPLAEPAIVLVDEIDLHLHPEWQRELIGFLSRTFPNTQFIATAHSPLVVQAAADAGANIVLLEREGDQVVVRSDVQQVQNWRIDQILTSDLFGLDTARSINTENQLKRRAELLSKARLTKKEQIELEDLNSFAHSQPSGETKVERSREALLEELARKLGK
ncbi:AAA family ATPase [Hymenobacter sp. NBH84]|uniref:AAA family ATPase n=1 Tax=Hymenobacter sp. NBH84 TaxID=2596915 RepID=UPI0016299803|nr:AAA family ATPase [Hymenobacter sp. NBH84]QNE38588.1 AAA family ATPase [Hymenobacter sp. NBH84]